MNYYHCHLFTAVTFVSHQQLALQEAEEIQRKQEMELSDVSLHDKLAFLLKYMQRNGRQKRDRHNTRLIN